MKFFYILFVVLISLSRWTTANNLLDAPQPCSATEEAALRQISVEWKDGYNHGDSAKVADLYAEDAYFTQHVSAGVLKGRREIQAYVQNGVDANYKIDSITIFSVGCSGDLAYSVGRYDSTNGGQKAFGHNIVVLRKISGNWKIVAHESAVPEPSAIKNLKSASSE